MADATTAKPVATIDIQTPGVGPGPTGTMVDGMRINFTTAAGHKGWVFVPWSQYTTEFAQQAVGDRARAIDAVGSTPIY